MCCCMRCWGGLGWRGKLHQADFVWIEYPLSISEYRMTLLRLMRLLYLQFLMYLHSSI